jgi:hypothetical protein
MEETRRSFLKISSIAAGSVLASGVGTQNVKANEPKNKLRLRGNLSNPIPAAKIREIKNRIISSQLETSNSDIIAVIELEDMPDDHNIVAFNFDIINGTPYGWVGVVANPAKGSQRPDSLANVRQQRVAYIHQKAKQNANARSQLRKQASSTDTTQDATIQAIKNWSNWNTGASNRQEIVDSDGNETGYDITVKYDPRDPSNFGAETEVRMLPQTTDPVTADWQNRRANPLFRFNGSCIDNVSDYGPGNSVGTISETISLGLSSDEVVEIGASKSNTSSNIDIDNHSDTYGGNNRVNQRFSISGDLKHNTVRINQAATTVGTTRPSGVKYCDMTLRAKYRWGACCKTQTHRYNFNIFWPK